MELRNLFRRRREVLSLLGEELNALLLDGDPLSSLGLSLRERRPRADEPGRPGCQQISLSRF